MAAKMARQSGAALGSSGYTPYGSAIREPPQPDHVFVPAVAIPPPPARDPFPFGDPALYEKDLSLPPSGEQRPPTATALDGIAGKLPVAWFVTADETDPRCDLPPVPLP